MSIKYIDNGNYAISGYALSGAFQSVTIGSKGTIGGPGLIGGGSQAYTIVNDGRITSSVLYGNAMLLGDGGIVTNAAGAVVQGANGVHVSGGKLTLGNAGTIEASGNSGFAVYAAAGGSITNSGAIEASAAGGIGVVLTSGSVVNQAGGLISGNLDGIYASYGGAVTNAANASISAQTGYAVDFGRPTETATIVNDGRIIGGTLASGAVGGGILLYAGGSLTNASGALIAGTITAHRGVLTVSNHGTLSAGIVDGQPGQSVRPLAAMIVNTGTIGGVYLGSGGTVTNSGAAALIDGRGLTIFGGTALVTTTGTIEASGSEAIAVDLSQGYIHNSAGALIGGSTGVFVTTGTGTVINQGTIRSDNADLPSGGTHNYKFGIYLSGGGNVTISQGGQIQTAGFYDFGVGMKSAGTVSNSGAITGIGGVLLKDGGTIINAGGASLSKIFDPAGAATIDNTGTILGGNVTGIRLYDGGIVTNRAGGVIGGEGGVYFLGAGTIVNFGTIETMGGPTDNAIFFQSENDTLVDEAGSSFVGDVIGDSGTLNLVGTAGSVSGLGTAFSGFARINVVAGASWTVAGTSTLASGTASSLRDNGVLTVIGSAVIAGTVSGTGSLVLAGTETIAAGGVLSVAHLSQTGGSMTLGKNVTYAGSFVQSAGPIHLSSDTLVLDDTASLINGAVNGPGFLATYGTVNLTAYTANAGAVWQVYGTVAAAGYLTLGNGGGGSGRLAIETHGVFDITGAGGVVTAPGGSGTLANFALLEKTGGTGVSSVAPALANSGTLKVTSGTLDFAGAVSGTGAAVIGSGATLEFAGSVAVTQSITFAGSNARLLLTDVTAFQAAIKGFDTGTTGDTIEVTVFATGTHVVFSQPQSGETVATLTNGSRTARLILFGQYSAAGFGYSASGSGTIISYSPPAEQPVAALPHH